MAQGRLNSQDYQIKFKRGLRANLTGVAAANLGVQAEPAYTADDKRLFIHDGSAFLPVPTLDMAIVNNGDVVTNNGEIVWVS